MIIKGMDGGKQFDWGRTSQDYAKYRDIYSEEFYRQLLRLGVGKVGQRVLDIGTGTGVIPRNMYRFGAKWIGTDISENQIAQAVKLSEGMDIMYKVSSAEELSFEKGSFDALTACQCYWYFDHRVTSRKFSELLTDKGTLVIMTMAWLPFEDELAARSEELVLKYSPQWSGAGFTCKPIDLPEEYEGYFTVKSNECSRLALKFTRESWHGRMRACRGVGASLSGEELLSWEREHRELLESYPEEFEIMHAAAFCVLEKK